MKVYISSTYRDLIEYREAARRAIRRIGHQPIGMEDFGSRPEDPRMAALEVIRECDAFVGIYAYRYGWIPDNQATSILEQEFDAAHLAGMPCLCYRVDPNYPWQPRLIDEGDYAQRREAFQRRMEHFVLSSRFTTPDDLEKQVASDVGRVLAEFLVKGRVRAMDAGRVSVNPIWRGRNFEVNESSCFVLMPFSEAFQSIYETSISPVVESLGLTASHAGEVFSNREIIEDIWDSICRARLIIADVTNRNPNVFYELGICHTLGREVIIITQSENDVPFDIRARRYLRYDPKKLASFRLTLKETIDFILKQT